jgi:hypothetical protein
LIFFAGFFLATHVGKGVPEKDAGDHTVRVVGQRLAQVFLGSLVAAAEESRHFEVPAAECAIGGALQEALIELQRHQERVLDLAAVLDPLPHSE